MSRSTSENLVNPAVKFLTWNSSEKSFQYYDKEAYDEEKDKQGKNVNFPHPFSFYVLDELFSIKGYNERKSEGIFSNEVRKNSDKIVIRSKSGKVMEGTYGTKLTPDLNEKKDNIGGKYVKSVYVAMLDENDEYKIFNLQLQGSGFEGWLEFTKKNKNYRIDEITFSGMVSPRKKGKNSYSIPDFSIAKATESANNAALALDKELQAFLTVYMEKTQGNEIDEKVTKQTPVVASQDDDEADY